MGPTQKAVLRCLASRPDKKGTIADVAIELEIEADVVHGALALLADSGLADRRMLEESAAPYTLTPLGERMAEDLGEDS